MECQGFTLFTCINNSISIIGEVQQTVNQTLSRLTTAMSHVIDALKLTQFKQTKLKMVGIGIEFIFLKLLLCLHLRSFLLIPPS